MNVELPLYWGATSEHLAAGAAVLGQTSIPIGGVNTNSVIAGHRGYQGAPYFREIENL
jgi:sortase A